MGFLISKPLIVAHWEIVMSVINPIGESAENLIPVGNLRSAHVHRHIRTRKRRERERESDRIGNGEMKMGMRDKERGRVRLEVNRVE